jgi:hypothetical protein
VDLFTEVIEWLRRAQDFQKQPKCSHGIIGRLARSFVTY